MESSLTPANGDLLGGGLHMKPWQHGEEQRGWASDLQRRPVAVVQSQTHLNNTSGLSCWDYRLTVHTRWGTNTHITVCSLCLTASWTVMITVCLTSYGPSFYCWMLMHGFVFGSAVWMIVASNFPTFFYRCTQLVFRVIQTFSLFSASILWKCITFEKTKERDCTAPQFWPPR